MSSLDEHIIFTYQFHLSYLQIKSLYTIFGIFIYDSSEIHLLIYYFEEYLTYQTNYRLSLTPKLEANLNYSMENFRFRHSVNERYLWLDPGPENKPATWRRVCFCVHSTRWRRSARQRGFNSPIEILFWNVCPPFFYPGRRISQINSMTSYFRCGKPFRASLNPNPIEFRRSSKCRSSGQ